MSTRSSMYARAGFVALSVLLAACAKHENAPVPPGPAATPPRLQKKEHPVKIGEKEAPAGEFTGVPDVDPVVIKPYDPDTVGAHEVVWTYKHMSTYIVIHELPDGVPQPVCTTSPKECRWMVATGLLQPTETKRKFKYDIKGWHNDKKALKDNDPEIEIDR